MNTTKYLSKNNFPIWRFTLQISLLVISLIYKLKRGSYFLISSKLSKNQKTMAVDRQPSTVNRQPSFFLLISTIFILASSCVTHKELVNFQEANFTLEQAEDILNAIELRVQPEDLLRITVSSFDKKAAEPFNLDESGSTDLLRVQGGNAGGGGLELFTGYLVDQDGGIDFPVLGRVNIGDLTIEEAKTKLLGLLKPYLKDAVINMRFLNFKVTVIGEVNRPGAIQVTNKRITILETIGKAGDLTSYANRTNILVIREQSGQREVARLDLTKKDIFTSPFFYLKQNDVVYVEPIKARVATVADPAQRFISYSSGVLSIITLIIALTR